MHSVLHKHIRIPSKCKEIPFRIVIYIVLFFSFFIFFGETSVHQGKLVNGVFYGVLSLPGNTSLDVFRTQMALQEEVEAAVGEQECVLQDPGRKQRGAMRGGRGRRLEGRREQNVRKVPPNSSLHCGKLCVNYRLCLLKG